MSTQVVEVNSSLSNSTWPELVGYIMFRAKLAYVIFVTDLYITTFFVKLFGEVQKN